MRHFIAALLLTLPLFSCATLLENINRPRGFIPAEDAECQWELVMHDKSTPFRVKAGVFERADPLVSRVTCRNKQGGDIAPGTCFEIDCVTPKDGS